MSITRLKRKFQSVIGSPLDWPYNTGFISAQQCEAVSNIMSCKLCTWKRRLQLFCLNSRTRSQSVARIADRTASHSQHLWDHVTSSVKWPFDTLSPHAISYWWSFGTECLSPAVFEVLRFKRIGVTSLTFQGHVKSSVTWPFDSPYAISYW